MAIAASKLRLPGGWAALAAAAVAIAAAACIPKSVDTGSPFRVAPVRVTGTLVVRARAGAEIQLPDATVYLANAAGFRSAEATTGLDGRFELRAPAGRGYRLCYRLGSTQGCGSPLSVLAEAASLGSVQVMVAGGWIHGSVLTADGRPCWVSDSFFGLDVSTRMTAVASGSGGPPAASARANSSGEYALLGLPDGAYEVKGQCEAAEASVTAQVQNGEATADFALPSHAPVIQFAAAFNGAYGVTQAVWNRTVALRSAAIDPDGDAVEYLWRILPGAGWISGPGANVQWHLPAAGGLVSAYLIARDGRGGYAYRRVNMEVARSLEIAVTGTVRNETTGLAIANAVVTLGGQSTRTNQAGWFSLAAEPRDDGRYVVNVRHPDFGLVSRVLDGSARGANFAMTAAQITQVAPGGAVRLVDRASAGFCGASGDERRRAARPWTGARALIEGDREAPWREADCTRRGAEIAIPAGALVGEGGRALSGSVRAAVVTLNPSRSPLPGDYSAIDRAGRTVSLLSYGAVDVQFTDAAGQPLNLRPGTSAEVRIPVPASQAGSARPTMAMWSYDIVRGRWIEEGEARLEQGSDGPVYVGRTSHFSTINIDLPGWNASNTTCLRVDIDPIFGNWSNKVLRAYVSYGGTAVQVREVSLDSQLTHAIYTIPWGTTLPHNTVRLELRGTDSQNVEYVLLNRVVDTDALGQMFPTTDPFPPYPYTPCPVVSLGAAAGAIPYYGDIDATGRPAFLTGPYGTFNPSTPDTAAYYSHLDTSGGNQGARGNLGQWWALNGFDANGGPNGNPNHAEAVYTNYNDLGFGRDMHCVEPGSGRLACYVTNYGLPDQSGANADAAAAHLIASQGGTVTMEYEPGLGPNAVRFFVYGGGGAGSPRINFADLDGLGPKPVPQLCTVCHGGNYNAANHDVAQARFREFDLPSFLYPQNRFFSYSGANSLTSAEIASFARLNQMVRDAQPLIGTSQNQPTPIRELIDGWYPSGFSGIPNMAFVPQGWGANPTGYLAVYSRSCRTCHIARDAGSPTNFYVFGNGASLPTGSWRNAVCGSGAPKRRVMPNAFVTYRNFWADPARVSDFETLVGATHGTCGS